MGPSFLFRTVSLAMLVCVDCFDAVVKVNDNGQGETIRRCKNVVVCGDERHEDQHEDPSWQNILSGRTWCLQLSPFLLMSLELGARFLQFPFVKLNFFEFLDPSFHGQHLLVVGRDGHRDLRLQGLQDKHDRVRRCDPLSTGEPPFLLR